LEKSGNAVVNAIYQSALEGKHTDKHIGQLASKAFVESKYKQCQYFSADTFHEQMQLRAKLLEEAKKKDAQEEETDEPPPPSTQDLLKKALQRQTALKQEAVPIEDQNAIEELFAVGTSRAVLETMFSPETVTRVLGKEDDSETITRKTSHNNRSNNRRDREAPQPRGGASSRRASIMLGDPQPRSGPASRRTSIAMDRPSVRRQSTMPDGRPQSRSKSPQRGITIRRTNSEEKPPPSTSAARQKAFRRSNTSDGQLHPHRAAITRPGTRPGAGLSRQKSERSQSSRTDVQRRPIRSSTVEVGPRRPRVNSLSGSGSPPESKERISSGRRAGMAQQASWHRTSGNKASESDHPEGRKPSKKLNSDVDSNRRRSSKILLGAEISSSKHRSTTSQKADNELAQNTWLRTAKKPSDEADFVLSNHSHKSMSKSSSKGDNPRRPSRTKGIEREMQRSRKPLRNGSDPSLSSRGPTGSSHSLDFKEGSDSLLASSTDKHHASFASSSLDDESFGADRPETNQKSALADLPSGSESEEWPEEPPSNESNSASQDYDAISIDSSSHQDIDQNEDLTRYSNHDRRLNTSEAMAKARG
jgi:hypothetical protein